MNIRLSSEKPGHGLQELLDYNNLDTYWSSDDILPHLIKIEFDCLEFIKHLELYISFHNDDSYTPEIIDFHYGPTLDALNKISPRPYIEPMGITRVSIQDHVQFILLEIKRNHSDGKDSHIRGLKIINCDDVPVLPDSMS